MLGYVCLILCLKKARKEECQAAMMLMSLPVDLFFSCQTFGNVYTIKEGHNREEKVKHNEERKRDMEKKGHGMNKHRNGTVDVEI